MSSVEQQALARLERGRARIAKGWCQGELARDSRGVSVLPGAPEAARWCAAGGLGGGGSNPPSWSAAFDSLANAWVARDALDAHLPPGALLTNWNDEPDRTQDEVLALYDAAIADLRAQIERAP